LIRRDLVARQQQRGGELDPCGRWDPKYLRQNCRLLSPKDDAQRMLKGQALSMAIGFGQMRWLLFEQTESSISMPFLVCWSSG